MHGIVPTGQRWEGHEEARQFDTSFLGAFPDVKFNLADIVIGPQGVFEVAEMTGTQLGRGTARRRRANQCARTCSFSFRGTR